MVNVNTVCPVCGLMSSVCLRDDDYKTYSSHGVLSSSVYSYLSLDDAEKLISGICNKCWDEFIK